MFSHITLAWRGRPLASHDVIINTIGAVTTATGLAVTAVLEENRYPTGTQVSSAQIRDPPARPPEPARPRHRRPELT